MNAGSIKLLIVEDSEDDTILLVRELKKCGLEVFHERVETARGMSEALGRQPWDMIISDYTVPGFGGKAALKLVRDRGLDTPFISVSGSMDEEVAVEMMRAGANDYLMKNNLARMVPAIRRELREAGERKQRRAAQEELKRSQKELEDFFEYAVVGVHFAGPDGTILRANQAELDLLGVSHDEYVNHNRRDFHSDPAEGDEIMRLLNNGETLREFEAHLRCQDGSVKTVLINENALWKEGRLAHTRGFIRDVTDLKRAENRAAHLATLVDSSQDAIIGRKLDGTIVSWNPGAEKIFGYTAEEMVGRSISQLYDPNRPDEMPQINEKLSRGERIEGYESVRMRKDGSLIEVSLSIAPVFDERGNVVGVASIARDITTRKEEEEERLQLIQELSDALANVKTLRGLVPICASCKKIRDDKGFWQQVEVYVKQNSEADFSHAICPECVAKLYPEFATKELR